MTQKTDCLSMASAAYKKETVELNISAERDHKDKHKCHQCGWLCHVDHCLGSVKRWAVKHPKTSAVAASLSLLGLGGFCLGFVTCVVGSCDLSRRRITPVTPTTTMNPIFSSASTTQATTHQPKNSTICLDFKEGDVHSVSQFRINERGSDDHKISFLLPSDGNAECSLSMALKDDYQFTADTYPGGQLYGTFSFTPGYNYTVTGLGNNVTAARGCSKVTTACATRYHNSVTWR